MSAETAFYTTEFWFACAILIVFLYGPWQTFVEAVVRQKLFKIRDELFDFAAQGNISFDNDYYIKTRENLNGFIRFAHAMTWISLLIGKRVLPKSSNDIGLSRLLVTDESLSKEVRDQLNQSIISSLSSMMVLMLLRSPFLLVVISLMFPVFLFLQVWNSQNYQEKAKKVVGGVLYSEISQKHASC